MALRLSIKSGDFADSGNRGRWTFGVNGGRIGRASDNDWVLVDPDRFISAHHAEIEHRAGEWWICDTSTNGTFVNERSQPLGRGGKHRIANGDRIRLGSLELLAEISGGNDFLPEEDLDLAETALDDSFEVKSLLSNAPVGGKARPADAYGQALPEARPGRRARAPAKAVSPLPPAGAKRPDPAAGGTRAPEEGERAIWPGWQALCQGAGLDPFAIPADRRTEALREAGQALRETVLGLMELSRSRAEFTREMGISGSRRQRDATSPLMQLQAVEEVLTQMMSGAAPGGQRAVDEIRSQFAKSRHHQQAVLVALREAITAMLGHFDPQDLEQQFSGTTRGPASTDAQARYWALYRDLFRSLTASGDAGLPTTFEEEFARAYQALAVIGTGPAAKAESSG